MSDVVFQYTDTEAVQDGVLVPLTSRDRVSQALWDFIEARVSPNRVPLRWPMLSGVEAMYPLVKTEEWRSRALLQSLTIAYHDAAHSVYDNGGVWHAKLEVTNSSIESISPGSKEDIQIWIMPNELGGLTVMFPSDY